jgi:NADH:ubiquinone oxidoreductase subunit 5 (subunit L)/multisubunit Na+/H+ antiporter MnhA subunit
MLSALPVAALLLALVVPPVAMAVAHLGGSIPALKARRSAAVLAIGAFAALGLEVYALAGTPTAVPGFEVTTFSGLVLVLVLGMGATVMGFASRSLRDEQYQERFAVLGAGLVGTGAALALTTNLLVLAAAWVATSLLTVALIRTGPMAGRDARSVRSRRAFTIGDIMLVAALLAIVTTTGDTAIAGIGSAPGPVLAAAGILLVLAASTRSASGPFVRWLPDSLGAPTPSSALLHAGIVNAGAVLMIKLAPAVAGTVPAATTALVIGGLTCVFAEAVMLTRPDIKGRLAWSTIAQMAFTMVLCGLGLTIAAALHLVAHGLYKGALFLGSGAAVRGLVRQRTAPPGIPLTAARRRWITVASFTLVGATMVATGWLADVDATANLAVPVGLAWVAAGCATAAWLERAGTNGQRGAAILTVAGMASLFLCFTAALESAVASSLGGVDDALSPLWVLPVLAALVLVALTRSESPRRATFLARAWSIARAAGRPTAPKPPASTRWITWRPRRQPSPGLEPALDQLTGA